FLIDQAKDELTGLRNIRPTRKRQMRLVLGRSRRGIQGQPNKSCHDPNTKPRDGAGQQALRAIQLRIARVRSMCRVFGTAGRCKCYKRCSANIPVFFPMSAAAAQVWPLTGKFRPDFIAPTERTERHATSTQGRAKHEINPGLTSAVDAALSAQCSP